MHLLQNSLGQLDHIPQPGIVLLTAEIVNKPLDLGLLLLRRDKISGQRPGPREERRIWGRYERLILPKLEDFPNPVKHWPILGDGQS